MTTIIRNDLTISGTYKLTENTQLASGAKITVLPGATLDLGGFNLLNFGTLSLEGNATTFAVVQNGTYDTQSTSASLISSFGNLNNFNIDSFFSNGSLTLANSLVQNSTVEALVTNDLSNSIFINSPLTLNTKPVTINGVTFFDSPVTLQAWMGLPTNNAKITDANFVGADSVITLSPFFSGQGFVHGLSISNSYIRIPGDSTFEAMVYDATDDLQVSKDLQASDFLAKPVTNSANGFTVGNYTLSTTSLLTGVTGNIPPVTATETHTLSVIVDKGVVAADAVMLKGLTENLMFKDSVITGHTVTYGITTFEYAQIDTLIMTFTRDGDFTDEFRQEIKDAAPSAATLTYTDAVVLIGTAYMDTIALNIAGADGLYVI